MTQLVKGKSHHDVEWEPVDAEGEASVRSGGRPSLAPFLLLIVFCFAWFEE